MSHTEIEVEFDRSLMLKDGYDPITHILTDHIKANNANASYICRFYDYLTRDDIVKALEGMISYNKLLVAPSRLKRMFIYALLRVTGNYKEMHGLLVNYKENPLCSDSTKRLYELYDVAKGLAINLISEFRASAYGKIEYNKVYNYTFGSKLCEQYGLSEDKKEDKLEYKIENKIGASSDSNIKQNRNDDMVVYPDMGSYTKDSIKCDVKEGKLKYEY